MRRRAGLLGLFGLLFGVAALASDTEAGQVIGEITALTHEGKTIHLAFTDVQLTSLDTSLERETRGDVDGRYTFADVPPGRYEIRFEHPTHLTFVRNDLVVRANRTLRVNVQLLPEELSTDDSTTNQPSDDPNPRLKTLELPKDE